MSSTSCATSGCDADISAITAVIVLSVKGRVIGAVVDSVSDVLELRVDQIKPAPEFNGSIDATYITGLGTVQSGDDERMLILLEIEAMMRSADMGLMDSGSQHLQ